MTSVERAFRDNLAILLSNASGIREGNAGAVHDARIATRRLRALLPIALAAAPDGQRNAVSATLRQLRRTLGAARDADVSLDQLEGLELRIPSASHAIASLRLTLLDRQASARRRMVKQLERLPLEELEAAVARLGSWFTRRSAARSRATAEAIELRARKLGEDIERAGGVYFPKRTHAVRISAKKLRYLLEFTLDDPDRKRTLKALKNVQQRLGKLQDRHTLAQAVDAERANGAMPDEHEALLAWIHAEIRQLHGEYTDTYRDDLREVVHGLLPRRQSQRKQRWLAIGAFAAPSVVFALARRRASYPSSSLRTNLPVDCAATVS